MQLFVSRKVWEFANFYILIAGTGIDAFNSQKNEYLHI